MIIQPFAEGWQALSDEDRLRRWYNLNKKGLVGDKHAINTMMHNFCISCHSPTIDDFVNFCHDIALFPAQDQALLKEGFYAMYNLSPTLLELRSYAVIRPGLN